MEEMIVGFVDILGFKDILKKGETEKIYMALNKCKAEMLAANRASVVRVSMFSDCVCISATNNFDGISSVIGFVSSYANALLDLGILPRGGIAIGELHHEQHIVFGGGLVEAYRLENEVARYPRIVMSSDVVDLIKRQENIEGWNGYTDFVVSRADDQIPFLNIFAVGSGWKNKGSSLVKMDGIFDHLRYTCEEERKSEVAQHKQYKVTPLYEWMLSYADAYMRDVDERMTDAAIASMED